MRSLSRLKVCKHGRKLHHGRSLQPVLETLEHRTLLNADMPTDIVAAETVEASTEQLADLQRIAEIQSLEYAGFRHLGPDEIVHLTAEQLVSIPNEYEFSKIPQESRAALTQDQVRSLDVSKTGISRLNAAQVELLTRIQVQSLSNSQFRYLPASQIAKLTQQQISTIQDDYHFSRIPNDVRAELKMHHVRGLNVVDVGIRRLTAEQVSFLTVAQIRSLQSSQFRYLGAAQTPYLTFQQVATIADDWEFAQITNEARAAISGPALLGLKTAEVGIRRLTSEQINQLAPFQIRALNYSQFRYLGPAQASLLTFQQVASIPNDWEFAQMGSEARAAIRQGPIQNLKVELVGIRRLSAEQIGWLQPYQIRKLDKSQFRYLTGMQSRFLTGPQMATLESDWELSRLSMEARQNLSAWGVRNIDVVKVGISQLPANQLVNLIPRQIRALPYSQFRYLTANESQFLSAEQIATIPDEWELGRMSEPARAAIRIGAIRSLDTAKVGISGLSDAQRSALLYQQIRALKPSQFRYLDARQANWLSAQQLASVESESDLSRMTDEARAAINEAAIRGMDVAKVGIARLTQQQVNWLSMGQVQTLAYSQFRYLTPGKAALLTSDQVASIPNDWEFHRMSEEARAAIRQGPISSLNVAQVGVKGLTQQQIDWLWPKQIRSLEYSQFGYLGSEQTQLLSADQISTIPDDWWFTRMSEEARAALTSNQVKFVDTADISIQYLTGKLRQNLTPAQIAKLEHGDFRYLVDGQVQHLTKEQFETLTNDWYLHKMSDKAVASLSREQLLSLPTSVQAELSGMPSSFAAPDAMPRMTFGSDGLAQDDRTKMEAKTLFNLVPHDNVEAFTIDSGLWTDPAIWHAGNVPEPGDDVLVSSGTTVTFDDVMLDPIYTLRIDGKLQFATDADTQLKVDTIVVDTNGVLHVGTKAEPIAADVAARIVVTADTPIDTVWDPNLMSRGLLSRGQVRMVGQAITPYVALSVSPSKGDTQLTLSQQVTNWNVGDRLVLTGTTPYVDHHQDEEFEIVAIHGNVVTIDQPLEFDHHPPAGFGLSVYVANFNRNVVVMSENPEVTEQRGHVMLMHNPDVVIENAGFYGMGRQDKRNPVNDPVLDANGRLIENTGLNRRGRYAVHLHRQGTDATRQAAIIRGSAVVDSPGWGFVNHSSYAHIEDNVAFHVVGSSFVTEDGDEIGSFKRNLSIYNPGSGDGIESRRDLHDFGHEGNGFWFQGPGVEVIDNIAASSAEGAFVFFTASEKALFDAANLDDPALAGGRDQVPVGSVPLKTVRGNIAFAARRGLETWFHMTHMNDGQTVIEDFTSWNTRGSGVFTPYTGRTTLKDFTVLGNLDRPRDTGFSRNNVTNNITYDNVEVRGFGVGISVPVNRATVIKDGQFETIRAIEVRRAHDTIRTVDIIGNPIFHDLSDSQLRSYTQYDVYLSGEIDMKNHDLETFFSPDIVRMGTIQFNHHQIYYHEQAHDFVAFPEGPELPEFIPTEIRNKTNTQLWTEYGIAPAGTIAPVDAVQVERMNGLVGSRTEYQDELDMVSRKYTNQLAGYVLKYKDEFGDTVVDSTSVDLREGWNLLTRQIDGQTRTFFVFGDTEAPTFTIDDPESLVVNPAGLEFGFVVHGHVFDNSFGHKGFRKKFKDLQEREVHTRADGSQYLLLDFQIKDLAGNTTDVVLELNLDPNAPLIPGTQQRDLPPREMPETLQELIEYYLLTGQSDLLDTLTGG